ncbi:MAG: Rpn family recombination-promoting nuclease/putative transposase [Candidatus Kapabacteria bacterium]|jgi:predicted transposase/invertase (TIGR01784 family)|nr:Rpn family recombination-promoting nuclease/putative transposase [Candidatus Kapabacteria bacterium]
MTKQRYINPFTDFGFKKLFGEEAHKGLLIDFLNALLPPKHHIRNLEYTKNEASGETVLERRAVFDIACTGDNGERFIVELQKAKQNYFKERSVFYSTFPIREQAERGEKWHFNLAAVYCIGVLDFVFEEDKNNPDYLHVVQLKNQRNTVFYDKLTFIYLEMPKFTKTEAKLVSQTDKWLYFIKHVSSLEDIPNPLQAEIFEEAFRTAEIAQFTPAQMKEYELSLKHYLDLQSVIDTAIEEAELRGEKRGEKRGVKRNQHETARRLNAMGLSHKDIMKATGLNADELTDVLTKARKKTK